MTAILYRKDDTRGLGTKLETFVGLTVLDGAEQLQDDFAWDLHPAAVERHGAPAFDESFTFVPLLSLGGEEDVANLQKRDTITGIQIMVELQGVVEH